MPSDPDRLKLFWAIKYDLRNHSHCPAMIVPSLLRFSAKKLEFRTISIFSCALAHAIQGVPGTPNPDRLKIFRAIKYDLRNHNYRLAMIVPHFLHFLAKQIEFHSISIFLCAIAHAFRVGRAPRTRIT